MIIGIDASRAVTGERTGTEAYAFYLIEQLIDLTADSEHQLRLYFNQPPPSTLFNWLPHVEKVVIPFPRLWTHLRLAWELYRRPPDVFFTPAHVIPLSYKGKSVATVHDLGYEFFPLAHTRKQLWQLRWSTRHNAKLGQAVIAVSTATKQDLVRLYNVPAEKIWVVLSGNTPNIEQVADQSTIKQILAKYSISQPYLFYIGTIQPRKNLGRLVEAYAQLPSPKPQLVIAGKIGWQAHAIQAQIEAVNAEMNNEILLVGYVPEADKAVLLSGADMLVYPSLYEGFGFPVLEGQACGIPVLCADNSSLPEVAGDGAVFVNAENVGSINAGISHILNNANTRQQLIIKGFNNVQRFSWQKTAQATLDVLVNKV
jgi:glycosyltransferase involved in cell wall biosynthesis